MIYNECSHGANIMTGAIRALISSTALLTGAVATSPAFAATLVDSNYGAVYLEAYSRASPIHDPVQFLTDEEDDDHDVDNDGIFILAPQPLSADVSVRSSGSHSSTSLAAEVTANWTTADHGTVTFNTLSSAFGDGTEFVPYDSHLSSQVWADNSLNSNLIGLNENDLWMYNFTPNADAILTVSFSRTFTDTYTGPDKGTYNVFFHMNDLKVPIAEGGDSIFFHLSAGQDYTIGLDPDILGGISGLAEVYDSIAIGTLNMTFDITAAPTGTDPGDGGTGPGGGGTSSGAVPEPASWALMIAGFGLGGAVLRRRATHLRVVFA